MRRGRRVSLPPYLLQCLADLVCGQRRQVGVRHCNRRLAALLESHRRGRDLEPTIASPDLKRLARPQSQSLSQRLGNDDPPCSVDGDSHGTHNAMEMTLPQPLASWRCAACEVGRPAHRCAGTRLTALQGGDSRVQMEKSPVNFAELLVNLVAEAIDLFIQRAEPFSDHLNLRA